MTDQELADLASQCGIRLPDRGAGRTVILQAMRRAWERGCGLLADNAHARPPSSSRRPRRRRAVADRRARPAPRSYTCKDCSRKAWGPMLLDRVWFGELGMGRRDLLCARCTERRLGRPVGLADLRDVPMNEALILELRRRDRAEVTDLKQVTDNPAETHDG